MSEIMISIAENFSESPAARYRHEGPNSGERFREDYLIPALRKGVAVKVNLDGVVGYGSSFLEESFGGLIRAGYALTDLQERLTIESRLETYKKRVWRYITSEAKRAARKSP